MKKTVAFIASVILMGAFCSCGGSVQGNDWTDAESALICAPDSLMRVLTVDNPADSLVLRDSCLCFSDEMLLSDTYATLAEKMVATVTSPEQDGVGIAGPQVGISRRVVAVMRYDKEGYPFEVYPNIRISAFNGEKFPGREGCLSVPGKRGVVERWHDIEIVYSCVEDGTVRDTVERVIGFSAVIFQHECDHLDGVIYTDRAATML